MHPGKQHSFRVASALKQSGLLYKYITTVYDKEDSIMMKLVKKFVNKENQKRASNRKCEGLKDEDVVLFETFLSLLLLLATRLDKKNFLNLCEFFGGQTITIPTIEDIENLTYSFLIYQYVNIDGMTFRDALAKLPANVENISNIKSTYKTMCEALKDYNFNRN